jgi:hypothetical protein
MQRLKADNIRLQVNLSPAMVSFIAGLLKKVNSFPIKDAKDHGHSGKGVDGCYLRVFTADGTTLLLVSGDPSNPTDIVTVPISTGTLNIKVQTQ